MLRNLVIFYFTTSLSIFSAAEAADLDGDKTEGRILSRTEFGRPDFQGYWFFGSRTPLQRPANLGNK